MSVKNVNHIRIFVSYATVNLQRFLSVIFWRCSGVVWLFGWNMFACIFWPNDYGE